MKKKYQVFISSTYTDLVEERKKALNVLLMADCIPACMEAFVATDAEQFEVIKRIIDLCDYYVLILGRRYGSINPSTGISYTEMEYNYAISKGIPVLVFALDEKTIISSDKVDTDEHKVAQLARFRAKAMNNRLASIWHSIDDLAGKLAISIMKAKTEIDRPGWQKGTGYDEVSIRRQIMDLQCILDLQKENQRLQEGLERLWERETEKESKEMWRGKYGEYEGIWIQFIPKFLRPYAVCELKYKEGCYHFCGFNYYEDEKEPIRFDSRILDLHIVTEDRSKSFCYIIDAHKVGEIAKKIHGFGEVAFLDQSQTGAYDGEGYFYDVASAKGETNQKALQEFVMVKHDGYLYERLNINKAQNEIEKMDFDAIYDIAKKYGSQCFCFHKHPAQNAP